jgi:hypothetical protein
LDTIALFRFGSLWGLIFGAVFCAATLIIGRINAAMLLNDYPPDVRAAFGPMSATLRRQAQIASLPLLTALLLVIVLALAQLRRLTGELEWLPTFIVLVVIFQVWNLVDLLILDWFLLMTLRPRFMILPGTEGLAGYRDFGFHFRKFLAGILFTLLLAGVSTAIAMLVEALI